MIKVTKTTHHSINHLERSCFQQGVMIFFLIIFTQYTHAMEQRIADFEIAIDAPWRLEPRISSEPQNCLPGNNCGANNNFDYGSIPLNIAVLDAFLPNSQLENSLLLQRALQGIERGDISTGDVIVDVIDAAITGDKLFEDYPNIKPQSFDSLTVFEALNGQFIQRAIYRINDLHEVEKTTGSWMWSANNSNPPQRPNQQLCKRWDGNDCSALANLSGSSEWHAIAMYQPFNQTPGSDVKLKFELKLQSLVNTGNELTSFFQYVNVHLGEAPLPKFTQNWYYGDIHYHSQGTDNDGEAGYSYRSALQAMSAIGLDFAFATDHASNSKQIMSVSTDISVFGKKSIGPLAPGILRDLSPDRFAHNIGMVNGSNGANRQVASFPRKLYERPSVGNIPNQSPLQRGLVLPQLFLGAEVDVIPEFDQNKSAPYGYGGSCYDLPAGLIALDRGIFKVASDRISSFVWPPSGNGEPRVCEGPDLLEPTNDGRVLIHDVQGPNNGRLVSHDFYGRQHLLHLPEDPNKTDAFISSDTSKYGGATRRLKNILNTEFNNPNGVLFLAHPISTTRSKGIDRLGPDIAPYSEASLLDGFQSEHVLGLQLWNENNHFKTEMGPAIPSNIEKLINTIALGLGITKQQAETRVHQQYDSIREEYGDAVSTRPDKKVNYFEPIGIKGETIPVYDLKNWTHQKSNQFRVKGLSMWDAMLMWGIDPAKTSSINWLSDGEPRRVFMAGGSDAHGDYNYRREGYLTGLTGIGDGALGSPRNLVFAGVPAGQTITAAGKTGTPVSQAQIVNGFRAGNFVVTDGPIMRLAYDVNKNGKIDAPDIQMGGVADASSCGFPLLVEWLSTPEFGPVRTIDLTIGVHSNQQADGWLYKAWRQSAKQNSEIAGTDLFNDTFTITTTGKKLTQVTAGNSQYDGWRGPAKVNFFDSSHNLSMAIDIKAGEEFGGIRSIRINPKNYQVGKVKTSNSCQTTPLKKSFNTNTNRPQNTDHFGSDPVVSNPPETPINPACMLRSVDNLQMPDKMYIRAELLGSIKGKIPMQAFANPVWFNFNNNNFQQCSTQGDLSNAPDYLTTNCQPAATAICQQQGARCEVLKGTNNSSSEVCRWVNKNTQNSCQQTAGIWTATNSRYAQNHPAAVPNGLQGACLTDVKNLKCAGNDAKTCKNFGATCEVLRSGNQSTNLCRWSDKTNQRACNQTVGIWTTANSKYAKKHPNSVKIGDIGACITEVNNVKNRIQ